MTALLKHPSFGLCKNRNILCLCRRLKWLICVLANEKYSHSDTKRDINSRIKIFPVKQFYYYYDIVK